MSEPTRPSIRTEDLESNTLNSLIKKLTEIANHALEDYQESEEGRVPPAIAASLITAVAMLIVGSAGIGVALTTPSAAKASVGSFKERH